MDNLEISGLLAQALYWREVAEALKSCGQIYRSNVALNKAECLENKARQVKAVTRIYAELP